MDILYKHNSMIINNEIGKTREEVKNSKRKIKYCDDAFTMLSIGYITTLGAYSIGIAIPAALAGTVIPGITAVTAGIVLTAIPAFAITQSIKNKNKKINKESSRKLEYLENIKEKYMIKQERIEERAKSTKEVKVISNNPSYTEQYDYNQELTQAPSLSLRK